MKKFFFVFAVTTASVAVLGTEFFLLQKPTSQSEVLNPSASQAAKVTTKKEAPKPPALTLENIFATTSASIDGLDKSKIVKIIATGDVIPARGVNWRATKINDFKANWVATKSLLDTGDLRLINLESPLFAGCPVQTEGFTFCGTDKHIEGMKFANVNIASLANNHSGNYGLSRLEDTENLLTKNGIDWTGFGHLVIKEIKGVKFGFLAYNALVPAFPRAEVAAEIASSKKKVDTLIVSIHWGKEYTAYPEKSPGVAPDDPRELAHLIIDAGADVIVGNHPHWAQGVEMYHGGFVTYAHGNFIFDQTWSEETEEGAVGEYTFYAGKLIRVHFYPTKFDRTYTPTFIQGADKQAILQRMLEASLQLSKN